MDSNPRILDSNCVSVRDLVNLTMRQAQRPKLTFYVKISFLSITPKEANKGPEKGMFVTQSSFVPDRAESQKEALRLMRYGVLLTSSQEA